MNARPLNRAIEEWRPIPNSKGYEVSSVGRVRRGKRHLKQWKIKAGYSYIGVMYLDGAWKRCRVHRLVLEAFVGPCPAGMIVCHNNGVRDDNRLENLRYDTAASNVRDMYKHGTRPYGLACGGKLCVGQVLAIRLRRSRGESLASLAEAFNVHQATISNVAKRRAYSKVEDWPDLPAREAA